MKYVTNSGDLIVKSGAYNRDKYFVKDLTSKKSGFANRHLINLLRGHRKIKCQVLYNSGSQEYCEDYAT